MKILRKFLSLFLYVFMGLPLLLGGMGLVSLWPFINGSSKALTLVQNEQFENLLSSPELLPLIPEEIKLASLNLNGKAAVAAVQSSIPAANLVDFFSINMDYMLSAMSKGETSFNIFIAPLKDIFESEADKLVTKYSDYTLSGQYNTVSASKPLKLFSPTDEAEKAVLKKILIETINSQPDYILVGDKTANEKLPSIKLPGNFSLKEINGLPATGIWLLVSGLGLCFASVMIREEDWRRRFGRLGSRLLLPGVAIMVVGLSPLLLQSGALSPVSSMLKPDSYPDLTNYVKFLLEQLSKGFLTCGLVGLGAGSVFISLKRNLPKAIDEESVNND